MSDDQFRAWRWDREDKAANAQALVLYTAGHTIRCDHHGLLVDGRRLDTAAIYLPVDAKDADRLDLGAPRCSWTSTTTVSSSTAAAPSPA
ncbi:hypothetical protein [Streptomyces sp. G45]|uniref:hypothetical protein n=1 Tax=Streptomyces sp. G45 TaxID=3406627 RepID=UPI003C27E142